MAGFYENEQEWQYVFISEKANGEKEVYGNTQFAPPKNKFNAAIEDIEFGDEAYTYLAVKEGDTIIMEWKEGDDLPT